MKFFYLFIIPFIFLHFGCNSSQSHQDKNRRNESQENHIMPVSNPQGARKFQLGKLKGYRLQIYTTLNREEALKYKAIFQNNFPNIPAYLVYEEPVFKVRVGDYLSKSEAKSFIPNLNKIKDLYGSFVVKCMVNYIIPERKDSAIAVKTPGEMPSEITWVDSSRQSLDLITEEIMTREDIERERKMQAEDKDDIKEEMKAKPSYENKPAEKEEKPVKVRGFIPNDSI